MYVAVIDKIYGKTWIRTFNQISSSLYELLPYPTEEKTLKIISGPLVQTPYSVMIPWLNGLGYTSREKRAFFLMCYYNIVNLNYYKYSSEIIGKELIENPEKLFKPPEYRDRSPLRFLYSNLLGYIKHDTKDNTEDKIREEIVHITDRLQRIKQQQELAQRREEIKQEEQQIETVQVVEEDETAGESQVVQPKMDDHKKSRFKRFLEKIRGKKNK